jgi:hypothetical protein
MNSNPEPLVENGYGIGFLKEKAHSNEWAFLIYDLNSIKTKIDYSAI